MGDAMGETIFADCMLESGWANRSRRSWTTLSSLGLQAVAIAALLILPILRNVALPATRSVSTPISLGRIHQPESPTHPQHGGGAVIPMTYLDPNRLLLPSHERHPVAGNEQAGIEAPDGFGGGDGVGLPAGRGNGFPISIFGGRHPVMPAVVPSKPAPVFRRSNMLEGSLIRRAEPPYPPLARSARIQGAVVLFATISKAGTIENLRVLSGHPLLVGAAVDAVKQWRYRPYILNGEPIEVETEITVNFVLGNQ
jgi:periplasmic protein TonB